MLHLSLALLHIAVVTCLPACASVCPLNAAVLCPAGCARCCWRRRRQCPRCRGQARPCRGVMELWHRLHFRVLGAWTPADVLGISARSRVPAVSDSWSLIARSMPPLRDLPSLSLSIPIPTFPHALVRSRLTPRSPASNTVRRLGSTLFAALSPHVFVTVVGPATVAVCIIAEDIPRLDWLTVRVCVCCGARNTCSVFAGLWRLC